MEFRVARMLRGPNLWSDRPVFEVWLGPEHQASRRVAELPSIRRRFAEWLPWMPDPLVKNGHESLLDDLDRLTVAESLLRVTIRLQRIACGRTDLTSAFFEPGDAAAATMPAGTNGAGVNGTEPHASAAGSARIALECEDAPLARLCLASAWRMIRMAADDLDEYDAQDEVQRLHLFADDYCLGPSTRALLAAARRRHIPARRLNQFSLVQLGGGVHQRRLLTAETDQTSAIAEAIAQDKDLTKRLLSAVGVPAPHGRIVFSSEDAWRAACEVGLPVVVKPTNANHGRGVSLNLNSRQQVETAFDHALREGDNVLVEQFARGAEHRLLVVDGRVIAATRGEPDQVEGDGVRTIAELVEALNEDPRRGKHYAFALSQVELDAAALLTLEQQGYRPESIPLPGEVVVIHRNGEYTTDETDEVHPQVAAMAALAAQTVGLDIAGVDLIAPDIGRPLEEQHGMIVEVNAGPGLLMHLEPQRGQPRPVAEMIVESMFPPGKPGRLPLVALAGPDGEQSGALVARLLKTAGYFVGRVSPKSADIDGRPLKGAGDLGQRLADLSTHPWLTAMVVEIDLATLENEGMPCEFCEVALVGVGFRATGGSPTGASGQPLDAARRVVASTILPRGWAALRVDDPLANATAMALGPRVIWLASDGGDPLVRERLAAGGRAVYFADEQLVFAEGTRRWSDGVSRANRLDRAANGAASETHSIHQTNGHNGLANGHSGPFHGGAAAPTADNARPDRMAIVAAAAAGWGLGLSPETIFDALRAIDRAPESQTLAAATS